MDEEGEGGGAVGIGWPIRSEDVVHYTEREKFVLWVGGLQESQELVEGVELVLDIDKIVEIKLLSVI